MQMQADLYSATGNILWISIVPGLQEADLSDYAATTQLLCKDQQADGLLLANAETHEVWVLNPDGSNGGFCGNGLRAVAFHLGHVSGATELALEMSGVKMQAKCEGDQVKLAFVPKLSLIKAGEIGGVSVYQLTVPNPHCVVVNPPESWTFPETAQHLCERFDCNVEFVFLNKAQGVQAVPSVFVYERGAGPTGACGSGAIATFKVLQNLGVVTDQVTLAFPGGNLTVCQQEDKLLLSGLVKWIKTTCI